MPRNDSEMAAGAFCRSAAIRQPPQQRPLGGRRRASYGIYPYRVSVSAFFGLYLRVRQNVTYL
jgi:hypothetical protein